MRSAVLGLGRVGFEFSLIYAKWLQPASHLGCQVQLYGTKNVAVCDVNAEQRRKAKEYFGLEHYFSSVNEMMRKFQPQLVAVATPTNTHADVVETVASYPCVETIFLEKPLATSVVEGERILKACRHLNLVVNYSRRWSNTYHLVKWHIPSVAPIITMVGTHPGPLLRTGTHMLDLFNFLFDAYPVAVQAFGTAHLSEYMAKTEDYNINGIISYRKGEAILLSGPEHPYVLFEVDIQGEKGRIQITDNGQNVHSYTLKESDRYAKLNELHEEETSNAWKENNLLLTAYCKIERKIPVTCTGEDAFVCLKTALALHYSQMHNCVVLSPDDVPKDYTVRST